MKLLPFRRGYRFATALGVIIAACHSGEQRDPLAINPADERPDAGGDAAIAGASGTTATGGNAGNSPQEPTAGNGGTATGEPDSGSAGTDPGDIEDAGDATVDSAVEAGPSCGDGHTDLALDEECDDGNAQHSDGCENDCTKTTIAQVELGVNFDCVLTSAGGVKCWGMDADGALGRGTLGADIAEPSQIETLDFGTSRRVTQISSGHYHACALFEDGKARCWGDNATGQLGIDSTNDYGDEPTEPLSGLPDLPLSNIQSIVAGVFGTCAIVVNGGLERMYCWGSNLRGELGIGNTTQQDTPGQMVGLGGSEPSAVITGWHWTCALLDSGTARCWGDDANGIRGTGPTATWLGDNELPDSDSYNALGLPGPVTMFDGNHSTVCAVVGDDAYCWGRNEGARAGSVVATYGESIWQTPGKVNLGDVSVAKVSASLTHSCALDDDGFVYCWGTHKNGSMGYPGVSEVGVEREPVLDYDLMQQGIPIDGGFGDAGAVTPGLPAGAVDLGDFDGTLGPDRAVSIDVTGHRTCVIMEAGTLRCWGDNRYNLLGYSEVEFIGITDSPAQAYHGIGYSDVNVFGPQPTP